MTLGSQATMTGSDNFDVPRRTAGKFDWRRAA